MKRIIAMAAFAVCAPLQALEVDPLVVPEINLGGRGVVTTNATSTDVAGDGSDDGTSLDFADSSFLLSFSKYLFSDQDYGFATVGFKTTEDDSEIADQWYPHQAFVGVGGPRYEVSLGRMRLYNTLIAFPTLRDDDLLEYRYVPNASSNADAEEYHIFGGQVAGSWWFTPTLSVTAAAIARTETDDAGERTTSADFNGGAFTLAYAVPEAIKFDRGVSFAGLGVDHQRLDALAVAPEDEMTAALAALSYNINSNPERAWALDAQAIVNEGAEVGVLDSSYARARAKSRSFLAALRYAHRPYLQTRWQAALNVGWKEYADFDEATSVVVAPSYVYRVGSGIDFLAQYVYEENAAGLADATGVDRAQRLYLGLSVAFQHTLNETVGERGEILNLEHGITDFGPAAGGH